MSHPHDDSALQPRPAGRSTLTRSRVHLADWPYEEDRDFLYHWDRKAETAHNLRIALDLSGGQDLYVFRRRGLPTVESVAETMWESFADWWAEEYQGEPGLEGFPLAEEDLAFILGPYWNDVVPEEVTRFQETGTILTEGRDSFRSIKTGNDPHVMGPAPYRPEGGVVDSIWASAKTRWFSRDPKVWIDSEGFIHLAMKREDGERVLSLIFWLEEQCRLENERIQQDAPPNP